MKAPHRILLSTLALSITAIIGWSLATREPLAEKNMPQQDVQEPIDPVATAPVIEDVPQPDKLVPPDIELHGTFINNETRKALISLNSQPQRWLLPTQPLNDDFYLEDVFEEHIIVRDKDQTLTLMIRISNKPGDPQPLAETPMPAIPAHAHVMSYPPVEGIDRVEPNRYRIDRDLLIKELNSGEIFAQVMIVPEEQGGFFIERIKEGSMAEIIGLRVGDTINKINDKPLKNVTDVLNLYKQLDDLGSLDVEINRMHGTQHLYYEFE